MEFVLFLSVILLFIIFVFICIHYYDFGQYIVGEKSEKIKIRRERVGRIRKRKRKNCLKRKENE